MDLWGLEPGNRIRMRDGAVAGVVAKTEDGAWIKARYVEVGDGPSLVGSEDLVHEDEPAELVGTAGEAGR